MIEILTDRELRHQIEQLIRNSEKFVFLVSPYLNIDKDFEKAIASLEKDVIKGVVYRNSEDANRRSGINSDTRDFLKGLSNIELITVKNLHAKFYFNEEVAIITSMNLTKTSNYNYEIGVLIEAHDDYDLYLDCIRYLFKEILDGADSNIDKERIRNIFPKRPFWIEYEGARVRINGKPVDLEWFESIHEKCNVKYGYCIRCGTIKEHYYPKRPFCPSCYEKWEQFKNPDYQEKYCHRCGMEVETYIDEPHCENCDIIHENEIEREWKKLK